MWRESKVIRLLSIIHNGIILDLVCGFSVVVLMRMFVLMILSFEWSLTPFILENPE